MQTIDGVNVNTSIDHRQLPKELMDEIEGWLATGAMKENREFAFHCVENPDESVEGFLIIVSNKVKFISQERIFRFLGVSDDFEPYDVKLSLPLYLFKTSPQNFSENSINGSNKFTLMHFLIAFDMQFSELCHQSFSEINNYLEETVSW